MVADAVDLSSRSVLCSLSPPFRPRALSSTIHRVEVGFAPEYSPRIVRGFSSGSGLSAGPFFGCFS